MAYGSAGWLPVSVFEKDIFVVVVESGLREGVVR